MVMCSATGMSRRPAARSRDEIVWPSRYSMTMKLSPSGVWPKSRISTTFSWLIWLAARASVKNRLTISLFEASSWWMTLIATRLLIRGCSAIKTVAIAPAPSRDTTL